MILNTFERDLLITSIWRLLITVGLSHSYNANFITISNNERNLIIFTFGDAYNSLHIGQLNYGIEDSNDVFHINSR